MVIAIATAWLFCLILTAAGAFDKDSKARTDARSAVLSDSPWFRVPYPGMLQLHSFERFSTLRLCCIFFFNSVFNIHFNATKNPPDTQKLKL